MAWLFPGLATGYEVSGDGAGSLQSPGLAKDTAEVDRKGRGSQSVAGVCCLDSGEGFGLCGEETRVLGDANHRKDFDEVRGKAEGRDLLAGVGSFNEQLNDEGDAARVDVIHLGEIEHDLLDVVLGEGLVCAEDRILRRAGNVPLEAEDGDRSSGRGSELVNVGLGFALHDLMISRSS